jgi:hypothetical protein
MRIQTVSMVVMVALAAACSPAPESDLEGNAAEVMEAMDVDLQDSVREALAMQEQALASTRDLAAAPEDASPEAIEEALNVLNLALLRGRQEVVAVRAAQEVEGRRAIMKQLRDGNASLREAYGLLVSHHPDPSPEMMDLGDDEES